MDRYKAKNKFIQYQLWQDCRNGCKFCSERCQKLVDKKLALDFTINKLDDPEVFDYEEVGIMIWWCEPFLSAALATVE